MQQFEFWVLPFEPDNPREKSSQAFLTLCRRIHSDSKAPAPKTLTQTQCPRPVRVGHGAWAPHHSSGTAAQHWKTTWSRSLLHSSAQSWCATPITWMETRTNAEVSGSKWTEEIFVVEFLGAQPTLLLLSCREVTEKTFSNIMDFKYKVSSRVRLWMQINCFDKCNLNTKTKLQLPCHGSSAVWGESSTKSWDVSRGCAFSHCTWGTGTPWDPRGQRGAIRCG